LNANGALREKLQAGELNQEEVAFFLAFTNGKKRFEDPDNPFLRTEDGQNINEGDSHLLMSGDREGSPEPEDNYEDDEEEGEMIIDEDPVDHSFEMLSNKTNKDNEDCNNKEDIIDP
jgi:hypothetical protein